MRSLVLKQDVATMYKGYAEKMSEMMPGKRPLEGHSFTLLQSTLLVGERFKRLVQGLTT